jgi:pimeloyl-ACP methyl ester carboxylesterase
MGGVMATLPNDEIVDMSWDVFEASLQTAARSPTRGASAERGLREYFGDEEYQYLQRLAEQSRLMRSRTAVQGNVVLLPGIMGSSLTTVDDGDEDLIWIHLIRLASGQIERLRLTPDGSGEADPALQVKATDIDKRSYARAILWLRARWNVQPFAYDWRKDIDHAAHALAAFIRDTFGEQPVHLLAHSMGGLVARNFIRLHRDLWDQMRQSDQARGGRLIMLGTPNFGSFAIPQALTGVESLVRLLAAADLQHDLSALLAILNSFVGTYQLLPAPSKLPVPTQALYRQQSWGSFPVSQTHLDRAFQFHGDLESAGTVDPERMIYIAGSGRETIGGLNIVTPGEFDYLITHDGDGRVPHALGLLKDVPTYYVDASHGDLLRHEAVLAALDDVLEHGRTGSLAERPPIARAVFANGTRWRRSIAEQHISNEVEDIARRSKEEQASPEEVRIAEETIMRAVMGQSPPTKQMARLEETKERALAQRRIRLRIEVVLGDVTHVQAPVIVVGHYKGVPPVHVIDEALEFWISRAGARGMIGAELGEVFFVPMAGNQIAAKAVLLAGMGEAGRFTRNDLRYLMTNVAYAIATLGIDRFASVLIGSGAGNLPRESALRAMLDGIVDAIKRLETGERLQQVTLVEYNKTYHDDICTLLEKFAADGSIPGLALEVTSRRLPAAKRRRRPTRERPADLPDEPLPGSRLTVERNGEVFRFSALSETAVIPVREVDVQASFASGVAEHLMRSSTRQEQEKYGRLLNTYLIPEEFHRMVDDDKPLTLILDRNTAMFPWEMASFRGARGTVFFGPHLRLTRQFRTMLSGAPGIAPTVNRALKVLVIADPAREPELQLPGARQEGREVVQVLNRFKRHHDLELDIVERIGAIDCDPVEILALILNEEFDVIHFAGHGVFDENKPARSGWVFGKDCIVSAREIFRARRVPRLVFANACFSSVVTPGQALTAAEMNRQLAGLAEAFFERGIMNYIGTGWPVEDLPAVTFATVFYENVLEGERLGEALSAARQQILDQGPTWGAYQHYGQVAARLVRLDEKTGNRATRQGER